MHLLGDHAAFDESTHCFRLDPSTVPGLLPDPYHLVVKPPRNRSDTDTTPAVPPDLIYRLTHPLGDWVLAFGKALSHFMDSDTYVGDLLKDMTASI